jgi:hypothetical protein
MNHVIPNEVRDPMPTTENVVHERLPFFREGFLAPLRSARNDAVCAALRSK